MDNKNMPKREDYTDYDTFMMALIKYNKRPIEIEPIPMLDDYKGEYDDYINALMEYLDKQPKYEPPEFTFITKLKEKKKWYYKEDD